MTFRIFRNMGISLLVVCLSITGCRKKGVEVTDNGDAETPTISKVIQPENVAVSPPEAAPPVVESMPPVAPPVVKPVQVAFQTSRGEIVVELDPKAAPLTVANFLRYVNEGFYDGTVFHYVISGCMVRGGGFSPDMKAKATHSPINNEASNGLKNERGTIAMAREALPNSATSQFYINGKDNPMLDYGTCADGYGYTVFGRVVKGMEVVDAIAAAPTVMRDGEKTFPLQPVAIKKATVVTGA